jgi:hypothetical protein
VLSPRMLRAALLLSPDESLTDDVDLFIEQAVIAVSDAPLPSPLHPTPPPSPPPPLPPHPTLK